MTPGAKVSEVTPGVLPGLAARKAALRVEAIAAREAIAASDRAEMAAAVARAPLPFLDRRQRTISAYSPVGAELDIMPLVRRLAASGYRTALPVVVGRARPLAFRAWAPGDALESGVRAIPVPPASAPLVVPDVLIVPLLLFDRRGYRLGYGGGFYDRTLAGLRATETIIAVGVGFSMQEIAAVPAGPHDERVDWLLTETGAVQVAAGTEA